MTWTVSPYRAAQERFADKDQLYAYLQDHYREDFTLWLGYYLLQAERREGCTRSDVAADAGVPKILIEEMLSGLPEANPTTYCRIARALGANPIELFIVLGWLAANDIAAHTQPRWYDLEPIESDWAD